MASRHAGPALRKEAQSIEKILRSGGRARAAVLRNMSAGEGVGNHNISVGRRLIIGGAAASNFMSLSA